MLSKRTLGQLRGSKRAKGGLPRVDLREGGPAPRGPESKRRCPRPGAMDAQPLDGATFGGPRRRSRNSTQAVGSAPLYQVVAASARRDCRTARRVTGRVKPEGMPRRVAVQGVNRARSTPLAAMQPARHDSELDQQLLSQFDTATKPSAALPPNGSTGSGRIGMLRDAVEIAAEGR